MATWVFLVFVAGSSDRVQVLFNLSYTGQIWFYRVAVLVVPVVAGFVAAWVCRQLVHGEQVEFERRRAEAEGRLELASRLDDEGSPWQTVYMNRPGR
jgi:hypothetical protein